MALEFEASGPLRGVAQLEQLVRAVLSAGPHDEADWIEWKSTLDLSKREAWFHLSRTILGLANRMPDAAARQSGGLGYILVGVEPGNLAGVTSVDPADLTPGVTAYVGGANGPAWSPLWVGIEDRTVLIVTVEAPQWGDPIWSLRKDFERMPRGRVFVRKHGRTEPADDFDLDALQQRLVARREQLPTLDVAVLTTGLLEWIDWEAAADEIAEWADLREGDLIGQARRRDRELNAADEPDMFGGGVASALARLSRQESLLAGGGLDSFMSQPEDRDLSTYMKQVVAWGERLRDTARDQLPRRLFLTGSNVVRVRVENKSTRFLSDVQVKVHFPWEPARGLDALPRAKEMPRPPREFGTPRPSSFASQFAGVNLAPIHIPDSFHPIIPPRSWVEDGSIRLMFNVGDLRPMDVDTTDDFYLWLPEMPPSSSLAGTWTATMRDVDGLITGEVSLPIRDDPMHVRALLEGIEDDLDGDSR